VLAASVIVWLFSANHGASTRAERRAQQLIAASYYLLVAYIVSQAVYDLVAGSRPTASCWWWADPAAALVIAGFALYEGRESWRGTACDCC